MDESNILGTISTVLEKLYLSIEGQVFPLLDKVVFIDASLMKSEPINSMFNVSNENNIWSFVVCFVILALVLFGMYSLLSMFNANNRITLKQILKLLVCTLIANSMYQICQMMLELTDVITNILLNIGQSIAHDEISFEALRVIVSSINTSADFLSIDGLIKGLVTFGAVTLVLNFAIRYVSTILLIIISPFVIILYASDYTSSIFINWLKLFIPNLAMQIAVVLVLTIPLSVKSADDILFKVTLVGSIYLLYRINGGVKEVFNRIGVKNSA